MSEDTDDFASLRSALIEALWDSGRHGCGLDECTDTVACPACRADLGADVDALLDALGMEQVGWGCVIEGRMAVSSVRAHRPTHAGAEFYEPVYRLGASDGR